MLLHYYISYDIREFKDVVIDHNRFDIDVTIQTIYNRLTQLLLSNTTSSNTTSLNSRYIISYYGQSP